MGFEFLVGVSVLSFAESVVLTAHLTERQPTSHRAIRRLGRGRDTLQDTLLRDARQDVRWLTSGAAPLIVYAFRRVRRSTSTDAFHTGGAGRAGVPLPSEAVHRTSPSDGPPRIKRERVPTCTLEPPWCDGRDALPRDARQDVRWLTSGAAPLIVYAFRRVRRSTSTDAFHTGDVGRAGVPLAIRGGTSDITIGRAAADQAGARPYLHIGVAVVRW